MTDSDDPVVTRIVGSDDPVVTRIVGSGAPASDQSTPAEGPGDYEYDEVHRFLSETSSPRPDAPPDHHHTEIPDRRSPTPSG